MARSYEGKHLSDVGIYAIANDIADARMIDGCISSKERGPARDAFIGGYLSIPVSQEASIKHLLKDLSCLDSL